MCDCVAEGCEMNLLARVNDVTTENVAICFEMLKFLCTQRAPFFIQGEKSCSRSCFVLNKALFCEAMQRVDFRFCFSDFLQENWFFIAWHGLHSICTFEDL